ncbi:hypothetical protein MPSEU_000186100 [Mayamaea pseudoterrestris]|nr:hypothetical protein MPSEU_000186100 [Mayamaea pseudoterrestris]
MNDNAGGTTNGNHLPRSNVPSQLIPTPGSRLTFSELEQHPPQPPVIEEYHPVIHRAICRPQHAQVLHKQSMDVPPIYLMRADHPKQAYALIPGKEPISLNHHDPNWGCIQFACIYPLVSNTTSFRAPSEPQFVAIKQLNKAAVEKYLRRGGHENPYKEIALMQEHGDNIHVLQCIEALQDESFLYIITPKACTEGTLKDFIPWHKREVLPPERIRNIFRKILAILLYLEQHQLAHRDLSPDNFLFLSPDNLVVFDLALSDRIPQATVKRRNGSSNKYIEMQQRTLILPHGNSGTRAWQSPEIFRDRVFDGVAADLWSAMVIFYNLSTNQILYHLPHPCDIVFRYFILAKGLSSNPVNERTVEVLMELHRPGKDDDVDARSNEARDLLNRAMAHLNFGRHAMQLLEHSFVINPAERWTLANAIESNYVALDEDE